MMRQLMGHGGGHQGEAGSFSFSALFCHNKDEDWLIGLLSRVGGVTMMNDNSPV